MGKVTGFLETPRRPPPTRPTRDRRRDFKEVYRPPDETALRGQAGRCMDCGVPFCESGCPLGNPIPEFNHHVWEGRFHAAWQALSRTNNFPELTGRLCPAPCETACVLALDQAPVTIEAVEKAIAETAFRQGWVRARPPTARTGFTVAVVGSGPAGLAAAAELNTAGHRVTIYEAADRAGGLLRYGIPDFKLEKWVLDRRLEILAAEGIELVTGTRVGVDVGWAELRARHDALLCAIGAERPRDLDVPGRSLRGVHFAMDYLVQQNRAVADLPIAGSRIDAAGKRVVILGGGDTGSDCLGTALRQGAGSVHQIELLPTPPPERAAGNPWPEWPRVFRTSSSQEEGGERGFALLTNRLEGAEGHLTRLHATPVAPGPDGFVPTGAPDVAYDADLVVLALGFLGPVAAETASQLGVALTRRGTIEVDDQFATNVPGVYSAGDAQRGASLIVWAIADGRGAAHAIDRFLRRP